MKTAVRGRICVIMIVAGLFWFSRYTAYMLFTERCEREKGRIEAAEDRCVEIAGWIDMAEGTVTYSDDDETRIAYFHYIDGAVYYKTIPYVNTDYPENAKVIVAYLPFSGPGDCLVSGFYHNRFLASGAVGMIISIIGVIGIKNNRKRMENKENGKKENRSR